MKSSPGISEIWIGRTALTAAFISLAVASFRAIGEVDYGWQLATGRLVLSGGPPKVDVLSWTAAGRPWIELRWLYAALLELVVRAGGHGAAVALKSLAILAAFGLAAAVAWRPGREAFLAPIVLLAGVAASLRFFVRPELVTFVLFALFLWILDHHRRRGGRSVWVLPLLQIVWVNSHTLFIMGPVLAGMAAAAGLFDGRGERTRRPEAASPGRRTLWIVFLAVTAACLLNPWGLHGALFPFELLKEIRGTLFKDWIEEFKSPLAVDQRLWALTAWKGLVAVTVMALIPAIRRLDLFHAAVTLATLGLSFQAVRNIPLFALAAIPFITIHVGRTSDDPAALARRIRAGPAADHPAVPFRRIRTGLAAVTLGAAAVLIWLWGTNRAYVAQNDFAVTRAGLAPHRHPLDVIRWMQGHRIEGPLFNTMAEGSCLAWAGEKAFIDPRLEVYGEDLFREYLNIMQGREPWPEAVRRRGFHRALIGLDLYPFAATLQREHGWQMAFWDETAMLLLPPDDWPAGVARESLDEAAARIRDRLPPPRPWTRLGILDAAAVPFPYRLVGAALAASGRPDLATPFLGDAAAAAPGDADTHLMLARALDAAGDPECEREFREAVRRAPRTPRYSGELGKFYARANRWAEAEPLLAAWLLATPDDAVAWALMGHVRRGQKRLELAAECFDRAMALAPGHPAIRKDRARVAFERRDPEARRYVDEALRLRPGDIELLGWREELSR